MTDYTKATDFAAKDALPSGDADKVIKGTEFETEFDAIVTAIATKADSASPTFTGTVALPSSVSIGGTSVTSTAAELNILDGVTAFIDDDSMATAAATNLASAESIKAYADTKAPTATPTFTGDVTITTGSVILSSGEGIDFSATANSSGTMASELFDDYEEGTFTPGIETSAGSGTITYNAQNGFYTKIGDVVFVAIELNVSSFASRTGPLKINALPFTANASTFGAGAVCSFGALLSVAAGYSVVGNFRQGNTLIDLELWDLTTGSGSLEVADTSGAAIFYISGSYKAA